MRKVVLIFSGYNQRAIVALIRTLKKNNLEYAIIANSKSDPIFSTSYSGKVLAIRNFQELVLNDMLSSIISTKEKIVADRFLIAPSSEALNRFLLKNKSKFEGLSCEIPLAEKSLYEKISDKYTFNKLCIEDNILVPTEYKVVSDIEIPFVAKPRAYLSRDGVIASPILIMNKMDYDEFFKKNKCEDFYYQQFLGGRSFYLLYYFFKDGNILKFSQENLMQQPFGKSILAAISSDFHLDSESFKYEKLFSSLNFHGLVMVEIRRFDNQNYMIEANPRLWGPSQLFVDAGINLFEAFLYDNGVLHNMPKFLEPKKQTRYFWSGGFLIYSKNDNESIVYHNYSAENFKNNFDEWMSADIYNREDTKELFKNK